MTTKQMVVENGMKEINAKLATAVVSAIIEMPTFMNSKDELAQEGNDGLFHAAFTKSERLDVDCYGNVSEQESYEIQLYEVLGGNELIEVTVEDGELYVGSESVELFDISTKAIVAMLTFMHGEGDYYEGACEEVAFSSAYGALPMYESLIAEWKTVYTTLMYGEITDDERVDYIERYLEISDLVGQLRTGTK